MNMKKKIPESNVALLTQRKKILEEIEYYEKRIEEARENAKKHTFCYQNDEEEDSDSDTDLFYLADNGPSIPELKQQQRMLQTCLNATRELTNLEVLQYETKVLVEDPPLNGAPPVQGAGEWREVVAECCLDLVPFAIAFYAFKANRSFAPTEYRALKVSALKKMQETELSNSVLPGVTRPSDAIEVIRSYSSAHRSRRTTLARLCKHFGDSLLLERTPEGGYRMKCANLMQMSWTLQNNWSPVAPFRHRTIFNFEYMGEAHVKIIKQAHRQLSEAHVHTDERTRLLTKIISTCLEAQGPTQEFHDSASSEPEMAHRSHKGRNTPDCEAAAPSEQRARADSAVMAPPTGQPKKAKKGNKNTNSNKKTNKRPIEKEDNENVADPKRAKTVDNIKANDHEENNVATSKNNERSKKTSALSTSESIKKKSDENVEKVKTLKKVDKKQEEPNTEKLTSANKIQKYAQNTVKTVTKIAQTHSDPQTNVKVVKDKGTAKEVKKVVPKNSENNDITKDNIKGKTNNERGNVIVNNLILTSSKNKVANDKNATTKNDLAGTTVGKITKKIVPTKQMVKKLSSDKNVQKVEKVASAPNTNKKVIQKVKVAKTIPGKTIVASVNKNAYVASVEKNPTNSIQTKLLNLHKPKATISSKNITGITKGLKNANPGKENAQNNLKVSKIPLKKFSSENAPKLPSRVSPRQPLKTKIQSAVDSKTNLKPK